MKIVRFQRHLPLTIEFYISCRISGVPPLQSDFSGLSSALKDNTAEKAKRNALKTNENGAGKSQRYEQHILQLICNTYTRTYPTQPAHDPHNARSWGPARSERGGALLRLGVGSPHKIFALARCMQHEMTVYHLRISSDGSSS